MSIHIKTFLLDDDTSIVEYITYLFRDSRQFMVQGFTSPIEFMKSIDNNVNLVITDVRIPNYNIFETIDFLHDKYPGIYIIVISGFFNEELLIRLMRCGVFDVVEKKSVNWTDELVKALDRVTPKILKKLEAINGNA